MLNGIDAVLKPLGDCNMHVEQAKDTWIMSVLQDLDKVQATRTVYRIVDGVFYRI